MIKIDSNKRVPVPKYKLQAAEKERKVFKAYCDAYQRLYVRRPTGWHMERDLMVIKLFDGNRAATGSLKRIEELTRNMNERRVEHAY